jgi:hypothetical protein
VFSRRAGADAIGAEVRTLYPGAPDAVVVGVATGTGSPRRAEKLTAWVHAQVRRAAVLEAGRAAGLEGAPYPADGEDSLRVYLAPQLADLPVEDVPAAAWAQAREDAWTDHGEALEEDRVADWAERLADDVAATLERWGAG